MAKATTKKPAAAAAGPVPAPQPAPGSPPAAPAAAAAVAAPGTALAPQPAPAAHAKEPETKLRDALFVKSIPATIRRAGFRFDRDGVGIDLAVLTDEQRATLENDPDLVVEPCQYPVDEDA